MRPYTRGSRLLLVLLLVTVPACQRKEPVALPTGKIECAQCRMTIVDGRFAAQWQTPHGRVFFFDSVECARAWAERAQSEGGKYYLHAFLDPPRWIEAEQAWIAQWEGIRSPMGKHWAAFGSAEEARHWLESQDVKPGAYRLLRWHELESRTP